MQVIDPTKMLTGSALRELILWCIDGGGRMVMDDHDGEDRMEERSVTGAEILGALRSGSLQPASAPQGNWRYIARRNDVEVVFTFDVDDEGNTLIIITVIRR